MYVEDIVNKSVETFTADIYVGLCEGYTSKCVNVREVHDICQRYCDAIGLGVTITPTTFVYTGGSEPGVIIGLINYPRFPSSPESIMIHVENLVARLLIHLKQERITVVYPNKTTMFFKELG